MTTLYKRLTVREALADLEALRPTGVSLALDTETTGLDHRGDRLRLVDYQPFKGLHTPADPVRIVDVLGEREDDVTALLDALAGFKLIAHNAQFDIGWFLVRGVFPRETVYCTSLLTKVTLAGERGGAFAVFKATSLEKCVQFFLRKKLNKAEQTSEWSRPTLTADQLEYAAADVAVLPPLFRHLCKRLEADGASRVASIESAALPCVSWVGVSGMPFRPDLWALPYRTALERQDAVFRSLRQDYLTNPAIIALDKGQLQFGFAMDSRADKVMRSPAQLLTLLRQYGYPFDSTGDDYLAAWGHPLGELIREYRENDTIRKSFNESWGRRVLKGDDRPSAVRRGRVFPGYYQCEAETGRMSCKYPNLQQVPNPHKHPLGRAFRQAFHAPEGRELVVADLSQIELRLAAQVSGDARMRGIYQSGGDIHTETARWILDRAHPDKHDRATAKSAGFGLLYGAGVERFRVYARSNFGIDLGDSAGLIRERWFATFPGIRQWHREVGGRLDASTRHGGVTTRTLAGRPRKFLTQYTEALNSPIQGSGADIIKLALGRILTHRDSAPVPPTTALTGDGWFPCAIVHDEIVLEVPLGSGEAMASWLRGHMIAAGNELMKDVPCDAEAGHRLTWCE